MPTTKPAVKLRYSSPDAKSNATTAMMMTRMGYDRLCIQDILNATGVSKGAFYHYFDSKQNLSEALVDRTSQAIAENFAAISDDTYEAVCNLDLH